MSLLSIVLRLNGSNGEEDRQESKGRFEDTQRGVLESQGASESLKFLYGV